jgi:hypothetical protein
MSLVVQQSLAEGPKSLPRCPRVKRTLDSVTEGTMPPRRQGEQVDALSRGAAQTTALEK